MRRLLACAAAAGALLVTTAATPTVTLTGSQGKWAASSVRLADGTLIDARKAYWLQSRAGDYPVVLKETGYGRSDLTFLGGRITSDLPASTPWSRWHDIYAMTIEVPRITIKNVRVDNMGDGVSFSSRTTNGWRIIGSRLSNLHDDAVENDYMSSGLIKDTLISAYVGLSAEGGSWTGHQDGRDRTVRLRGVLLHHKPMPTVYKGKAPGTGPLWKWSDGDAEEGYGPMLSIQDTIILVNQDSGFDDIRFPRTDAGQSYLRDCARNVIVWTGQGPYPGDVPKGFRLTRDKTVWNEAVADWKARHPRLAK